MASESAPMNALYAQSGGMTAVMNVSAMAVIQTARKHGDRVGKVFAARNGIVGALMEDLVDTSVESDESIEALRYTPSGTFGSCRFKLKDLEDDPSHYERLVEIFKAHNIGYFFYNGGGDSADTCLKVSRLADRMGFPVKAVLVPKTIDNDLPITDCCPGFGSVAKYVAVSTREASLDVASMCATSTKIFILEVMGRNAGWIAAAGGLAADAENDIPVVILFPEIPFEEPRFLRLVKEKVESYGYCTIVVSEGIRHANGKLLADSGMLDVFGHTQLGGAAGIIAGIVWDRLKYKYHWALADYLQRAARHIASKTDVDQAYALGKAAVELAIEGKNGVMPTIDRLSSAPYEWKIGCADLKFVANVEKKMPREYISEDGYGISAAGRAYLQPLVVGEDHPPFSNGLPVYAKLKKVSVPKKLKRDFRV